MPKLGASLLWVCAVAVLAAVSHFILFGGVDAPPADFGGGSMFDMIATRYDVINRVLALRMDVGWRKEMVGVIKESLTSNEHPKIVDVATGTADVAMMLAKEIPRADVTGLDPSNNMLDVGRQKVQQEGLGQSVHLRLADARDFSTFQENMFDAATMAFGIRNIPERDIALCQIHKVLKPSSTFCILEFSEPDASFGAIGAVARVFIRYVVPYVGGVLSGFPREYLHLQNSIKDFPSPRKFADFIQGVKCEAQGAEPELAFKVEETIQMNFGSVQLYVITSL